MAVDKRIVGAVPIVMPIANMVPNINHQYEVYGGWSFALDPCKRVECVCSHCVCTDCTHHNTQIATKVSWAISTRPRG
jgi:PhoPQ-activated pathogenicity-related protein